MRFTLTAGQKGDAPQAAALIEGLPAEIVMADTAYDADHLRQAIAAKGALAVIPNNPSRALKYPLDKHLYAQRHLVECCISKLKQFRRVATRFEKTARNYLAVVTLAAIVLLARFRNRRVAPRTAVPVDAELPHRAQRQRRDQAHLRIGIKAADQFITLTRSGQIVRIELVMIARSESINTFSVASVVRRKNSGLTPSGMPDWAANSSMVMGVTG